MLRPTGRTQDRKKRHLSGLITTNFFNTYRLGPEDVISVEVFNQERYSRKGIIIPPSGRISLSLIPGGVFVNGKTVDEVAEIIRKHYDEYIIDPQVTVSLDKAMSYRYSVDRRRGPTRYSSDESTHDGHRGDREAGGVLNTGDKSGSRVTTERGDRQARSDPVNVSAIYKGKAPDNVYLEPGDQIVVPGNKMKKVQSIMSLTPIASFRSHLRRASAVSKSNAHSARIIPGSVTRRRDHVCPDRHVGAPE